MVFNRAFWVDTFPGLLGVAASGDHVPYDLPISALSIRCDSSAAPLICQQVLDPEGISGFGKQSESGTISNNIIGQNQEADPATSGNYPTWRISGDHCAIANHATYATQKL